jgi:hypothetical protein
MQDWILPAVVGGLAVVTAVLGVALVRLRRRDAGELARARDEADRLRERVAGIEERLAETAPVSAEAPEFVITELGTGPADSPAVPAVPARIDGRLFADLVLRESVVKAAALAHGVRRACGPETRYRIRYEIKRETKRSRKQRRVELRAARRYLQAQRRTRGEDAA